MTPVLAPLFFIATMLPAVTAQNFSHGFGTQLQLAVDALADILNRGAPISGEHELILARPTVNLTA